MENASIVQALVSAVVSLGVLGGLVSSQDGQWSAPVRRVCGGRRLEHPLRVRHGGASAERSLHHLGRTLDHMSMVADQILADYRRQGATASDNRDLSCIAEIVPEVESVFEVDTDQLVDELSTDYQVMFDMISLLNLIHTSGNDVDLHVTTYLLTLKSLAYDSLCHVNKAAGALETQLPRDVNVPVTSDTCNVGNHTYSIFVRNFELMRQVKTAFRKLYVKYHFAAQLYNTEN